MNKPIDTFLAKACCLVNLMHKLINFPSPVSEMENRPVTAPHVASRENKLFKSLHEGKNIFSRGRESGPEKVSE